MNMKLVRFQRPELWDWQGFDPLNSLRDEIDRLFPGSAEAHSPSGGSHVWAPPLDLYENKDSLVLRAELPGMKREDFDISLHDDVVTVSGGRENGKRYEGAATSREERFSGQFSRSLKLPKSVNPAAVKASYKDGVLTVTLAKADDAKPRRIQIQ